MSWRTNPILNTVAGTIIVGVIVVRLLASSSWFSNGESDGDSSGDAGRAEKIYGLSGEAAVKEAGRFMVGTWTYTGPDWRFAGRSIWLKWVVKADGTLLQYTAPAVADNWGEASKGAWQVTAEKFVDTGKRWYAFHVPESRYAAVIYEDGSVEYPVSDVRLRMTRGDAFPFTE